MAQVSKICRGSQNTQIFYSNPKTQKPKSEKPSTVPEIVLQPIKDISGTFTLQRRRVLWVCDWFGFWILILLWILILILAGFCSTEVGGVIEIREK